jgi:adenylosuccinate lyase
VLEAEEFFAKGQKGSSAMPHKRNPIVCERIAGLARLMRAYALSAMENQALWHERDISHSSVERIVLPDANCLLHYMLQKTVTLIERMAVYPQAMRENLEKTNGLIFSQAVLLALVRKGMDRDEAYRVVQDRSMECWKTGRPFKDSVLEDSGIRAVLSDGEIEACFDMRVHLRNVDRIYKRVGLFP